MGIVDWARSRSPWVLHLNTGSCNGCDIEVVAALSPAFDLERLGVLKKGSPRHADVIILTGVVTRQWVKRLCRIYEQTAKPVKVVAVGACAISGGIFDGGYNVHGRLHELLPVDAYIVGCPPKPEAIIYGLLKLTGGIKRRIKPEYFPRGGMRHI
jgi:Ni,Fe-hydrogenase III small subunit